MKQYGFVYVTVGSFEEAKKIAKACLQQKLSACANIFPAGLSCYEWEGKYIEEEERVLILKTRKDLFESLCEEILKHHSYTCPLVVFISFSKANLPFLSWLDSNLKKPSRGLNDS